MTRTLLAVWCVASIACAPAVVPSPKPPQPAKSLKESARSAGIRMPFDKVFLRAFKREGELELWAANARSTKMTLVKTYPIAAMSGGLGPKRREGDYQVPEGFYVIDRFNPHSMFHLSLGLNYPNRSDRIRGDQKRPGFDIFVHGNQVSIGCLAMTDELIDEIYPACEKAGNRRSISVHIFPTRLTEAALGDISEEQPEHAAFWRELKPVYDRFEKTRVVPRVAVSKKGAYSLQNQ